jgi:hypothetical protein
MTTSLLSSLYKDLKFSKELKGALSQCLGVEIVEVKEKKVNTNEIIIQIENALSGKILFHLRFNKEDTIEEMKKQVKKTLRIQNDKYLYDFDFYNENRDKITNLNSDTIQIFIEEDVNKNHVLAVLYKTTELFSKEFSKQYWGITCWGSTHWGPTCWSDVFRSNFHPLILRKEISVQYKTQVELHLKGDINKETIKKDSEKKIKIPLGIYLNNSKQGKSKKLSKLSKRWNPRNSLKSRKSRRFARLTGIKCK